jgi:hypothetical protein
VIREKKVPPEIKESLETKVLRVKKEPRARKVN